MKKLLLLFCVVLTAFILKGQDITLNGYSRDKAHAYVKNFNVNNRTPTYFWFSRQEIQDILDLLAKEQQATPTTIIDGIRIYWGSTTGQTNDVLILVSTYQNGKDTTDPTVMDHLDYFAHDQTQKLYTDKFPTTLGIFGDICQNKNSDCSNGANLYIDCGSDPCPEDKNCPNYPTGKLHYITRKYGQNLVKEFAASTQPITTHAVWYELGMLQEIHNDMIKYHKDEYDGLRIYFARHPKNDPFLTVSPETFVIEATRKSGKYHIDSYDCNTAQGYFDGKNIDNIIKPIIKTDSIKLFNLFSNELIKLKVNPTTKQKFLNDNKFKANIMDFNSAKMALLRANILANGLENGEICPTHCTGALLYP